MRFIPFDPNFQSDVLKLNELTVRSSAFIGRTVDPAWHDDLQDIPTNYAGGVFLLAFDNDRLVGMGGLRRLDAETADVGRIRVHPDFQGRGFSAKIMSALEREARRLGLRTLVGHAAVGNVPAERMFRHAGFTAAAKKDFHGVPCTLFAKTL